MSHITKASHPVGTPVEEAPSEVLNSLPSAHAGFLNRNASVVQRLISRWERLVYRPDLDFEETCKRRLFTILVLPGILMLFSFGVYHLIIREVIEGLFDLVACSWLVFTLAVFRIVKNGIQIYRFNAVLLGSLFLFLVVQGGIHGYKILWAFSYPLIALYTLGKKEGLILSAVLFFVAIGFLYLPQDLVQVHDYAPEFKFRFCVVFFFVSSLTAIYESVREHIQTSLEDERNKLKIEKTKLDELSKAIQKTNQALTISEERLTRAQAIAHVGNFEYDIASGVLWGSGEALRILGFQTTDPHFQLSALEQVIPDFAGFSQDLEKSMRNNREYDREMTMRRPPDGTRLDLRIKAELVKDESGAAQKVIGVIQDVSDLKEAERSRRELKEKLERSRKMESLGLLAGGVAHDLNNVLSGVVGYPNLLLRSLPPTSPLAKPLQRIQESGQKAAAIVQDLLTLARRGVTNHTILDLNALVTEFMASPELAHIQTWHARVAFETYCDPDLLNIRGSAVHLKKTIMNLVSNAAEALPAGGRVEIRTENHRLKDDGEGKSEIPDGDYAVLDVRDNGVGISKEDLSRIFEPFYTKKKMGRSGTGLGMSVVWGTVQDHQGHIQLDSTEGVGTRVTVYFPATREPVGILECAVPLDEYVGRGETILVVDDVMEQRELAQSMLSRLGYAVCTAAGGEAALEFLSHRPVDLVVLDMIMDPGIDGLETYTRILESYPDQRAIIVSGFSETERVRKAQRLGAKTYVKKPYTLENLGVAVRQALS